MENEDQNSTFRHVAFLAALLLLLGAWKVGIEGMLE
jgi:hypothetical protein